MKNLKQELSALTYNKACALLGDEGEELLRRGGFREIELDSQLSLGASIFWLNLPDASVTISTVSSGLQVSCSECLLGCEHAGAALSIILEEKEALGLLGVSPYTDESTGGEIVKKALSLREERAEKEDMELNSPKNTQGPWGDYHVLSHNSGKTYRVSIRGLDLGESFCSCPDFKCNTLGTCKHIIFAHKQLTNKYDAEELKSAYNLEFPTVHLTYGEDLRLKVELPENDAPEELKVFTQELIESEVGQLVKAIQACVSRGQKVVIYPDASEYIDGVLFKQRINDQVEQIRQNTETHPLLQTLLKEPLLPYQLDGIGFAAQAGRSVIADDMGLGKTVQAIGFAEFLFKQAGIKKVLVITPASLKNQWQKEIERFTERSSIIIDGSPEARSEQYGTEFFSICNYEQILKDKPFVDRTQWDLIILDEGQRIKNYESKTSKVIKSLSSTYALVLSGTPLENRLEDLFSIINFVDSRLLGPAFQFFEEYQVKDEKGRLTGYKNLDKLRAKLSKVLIRRTRKNVLPELPPMSEENRFIPPSEEQVAIDTACRKQMQMMISKKHLSEMDILKLRKAMTESRMSANCASLVTKDSDETSGKLSEIYNIVEQLNASESSKVLVFSEWNLMLDKIARLFDENEIVYNRIDGRMTMNQKELAVETFSKAETGVLLCSNTAALGLNLQSADTVINVDIPWSPTRMEQRKARAHRLGQLEPVHVINLITSGTIEERLFNNFDKKMELFTAALDPETDVTELIVSGGISDLRTKLQSLLSTSKKRAYHRETVISVQEMDKDALARSAGQLLAESLNFLADLVPAPANSEVAGDLPLEIRKHLLSQFSRNESGELELTVKISNDEVLDRLAASLAKLGSWKNLK
ncbi:MAG: SNF2-related protein [Lentisphaeraceae bacterium]|nr:SNF2-related protein [Lentisphaeraceae bacterium]